MKPSKLFEGISNKNAELNISRLKEEGLLMGIKRNSIRSLVLNETFQSTWEGKTRRQGNLIVNKSIGKYPPLFREDSF